MQVMRVATQNVRSFRGHDIAHRNEKGVAIASRWPIAATHELASSS
jgi:hypothetical protein